MKFERKPVFWMILPITAAFSLVMCTAYMHITESSDDRSAFAVSWESVVNMAPLFLNGTVDAGWWWLMLCVWFVAWCAVSVFAIRSSPSSLQKKKKHESAAASVPSGQASRVKKE